VTVAIVGPAAPFGEASDASIDRAGSSIAMACASIEATCSSIEQGWQPIAATLQSIETTWQSIEAALQSIAVKYDSIETACSYRGQSKAFGAQAFSFSEARGSSIDAACFLCPQNVHSIGTADTLVETRGSVARQESSLVDTIGSLSLTNWNSIEAKEQSIDTKWQSIDEEWKSIEIDCSPASIVGFLAPVDWHFVAIVCQVATIASSFVDEGAVPRGGNAPSRDERRSSFLTQKIRNGIRAGLPSVVPTAFSAGASAALPPNHSASSRR
jgi:hypothetical protein